MKVEKLEKNRQLVQNSQPLSPPSITISHTTTMRRRCDDRHRRVCFLWLANGENQPDICHICFGSKKLSELSIPIPLTFLKDTLLAHILFWISVETHIGLRS